MSLLLLLNPSGLNPSPVGASPFAGAAGASTGVLNETPKGTPTIYTATPGNSTAVRLVASNPGRRDLVLQNAHATIALAYGFSSTLTFATGIVIPANTTVPFPLNRWTGEIWVIAASATSDARAIETVTN